MKICANDVRKAKAQDKLWLVDNGQYVIKDTKFCLEQTEELKKKKWQKQMPWVNAFKAV